jgi:oligosaccharide repeat unit polymerase
MFSLITLPFYLAPLLWCARRGLFTPSTVFFAYSMLGCWMLGFLMEAGATGSSSLIEPSILTFESIPWATVAAVNLVIFLMYRLFKRNRKIIEDTELRIPSRRKVIRYITLLSILIAAETLLNAYLHGGVNAWIAASYKRTIIQDSKINLLLPLMMGANVMGCIVLSLIRSRKFGLRTNLYFGAAALAQCAFLFFSGGRSMLILFLFSMLIIRVKRITAYQAVAMASIATAFVLISGYMIAERYRAQGAQAEFAVTLPAVVQASYTGLPFIDHIALSQIYSERKGHDYGAVYLNSLTAFVPRDLWPDKPVQLSRHVRNEFFGDSEGGIPPGLFGEGFIAFGYPGLLLVAVSFGMLLAALEGYSTSSPSATVNRLRTAIFSGLIGFVLVRGGIDIGVYRVGLIVVIYVLMEKTMIRYRRIGANVA